MKLLDKIKSFFVKPEIVEPRPIEPIINDIQNEFSCLLCNSPILDTDNVKEVNGNKFHKRCFKKMRRGLMAGKNIADITKENGGGNVV